MAELIKESKRIMSDVDNNNNKFWYISLFNDNSCITEWGRVGKNKQSKVFNHSSLDSAEKFFHKKCKEKDNKGYHELKIVASTGGVVTVKQDLETIAKRDIATQCLKVNGLVSELAKANIHNIVSNSNITYNNVTGLFETPCGVVTQECVDDARKLLMKIASFVQRNKLTSKSYKNSLNKYLMLIPQDVGMKLNPENLYKDMDDIKAQNDILDSLEVSIQAVVDSNNSKDEDLVKVETPKTFNVEIEHVDDVKIINRVRKKYKETRKDMHVCAHLDVKNVFKIKIPSVHDRFESDGIQIGNVMELWHGTNIANVLSILKGGMIIPNSNASHCTGRMFGDGLYFASSSTKSLNYAYGYWSGRRNNKCFMFLADVAMGNSYVPKSYNESLPKPGYDSTWAKSGKSGVMNDEFIVYDLKQANLTYLIEFE